MTRTATVSLLCALGCSANSLDGSMSELTPLSFNQVTVDGDSSTNDTFLLLANGAAGNAPIRPRSPEAQVLLYSTARAQNVREVIRPAIEAGMVVIADRFFDSTMAYQGYGHGADLDHLSAVTVVVADQVGVVALERLQGVGDERNAVFGEQSWQSGGHGSRRV